MFRELLFTIWLECWYQDTDAKRYSRKRFLHHAQRKKLDEWFENDIKKRTFSPYGSLNWS